MGTSSLGAGISQLGFRRSFCHPLATTHTCNSVRLSDPTVVPGSRDIYLPTPAHTAEPEATQGPTPVCGISQP